MSTKKFKRAIHWFRRDLRIKDNTALISANTQAEAAIPAYVISSWEGEHRWTGPNRQAFLCGCLDSLATDLESAGGQLIFRRGAAVDELLKLARQTKAEAIFFNRDPDPFGRETEQLLKRKCEDAGIETFDFKDCVLHEADEVRTQSGDPYRVFTPYGKNWRKLDKPAVGGKAKGLGTPSGISSLKPPTLKTWKLNQPADGILEPGEGAARKRMKKALTKVLDGYDEDRDKPHGQTTSRLGQDLRFGLISIRELFARSLEAGFHKFISELAWREFYMAVLAEWPEVLESEFNPSWRGLEWEPADERFERWKTGQTGFPIVDAGVRQLLETGFMHNRVRMIVAMFLTKDLRIDWREGEQFFMQQLVDGEIASNNGGWQWSAGVGADAAPYFRIQNPWTQTGRYDPEGKYVKEWVPELKDVDPKRFAKPPDAGESVGPDYPEPMVDHSEERQRTLDWFAKHRKEAD